MSGLRRYTVFVGLGDQQEKFVETGDGVSVSAGVTKGAKRLTVEHNGEDVLVVDAPPGEVLAHRSEGVGDD